MSITFSQNAADSSAAFLKYIFKLFRQQIDNTFLQPICNHVFQKSSVFGHSERFLLFHLYTVNYILSLLLLFPPISGIDFTIILPFFGENEFFWIHFRYIDSTFLNPPHLSPAL